MADKRSFKDVNRILEEVEEALDVTAESKDVNELLALQLLLEITREIHNTRDIHQLVTLILDSAIAFSNGSRAFLMLERSGEMKFKMGRSRKKDYLTEEEFTPSSGVIEKTIEKGKPIVIADAQQDMDLNKRQSVQEMNLRTVMAAPLKINDQTIGVLYVDSQRWMGRSSRAHLSVMGSLADQAAIAINNAQKFETQQ